MTEHQLAVQARFCPEILERVLRVVRHRGFSVRAMKMDLAKGTEGDNVNIALTLAGVRPLSLLCTQLLKLADVAGVDAGAEPAAADTRPDQPQSEQPFFESQYSEHYQCINRAV